MNRLNRRPIVDQRERLDMHTYVIVVRGTMSPALVAAIDGFSLDHVDEGQTHLRGKITDQAHLMGVVAQLRDYTAEIVSINPESDARAIGDDHARDKVADATEERT